MRSNEQAKEAPPPSTQFWLLAPAGTHSTWPASSSPMVANGRAASRRHGGPIVVAVTGIGSSGALLLVVTAAVDDDQTALGEALASELNAPLLHVESATVPLQAAVRKHLSMAGTLVLVIPPASPVGDGRQWEALPEESSGTRIVTVRVVGAAEQVTDRAIGDDDRHAAEAAAARSALIQVDGDLTPEQQVARLLPALGIRSELPADNAVFSRRFDAIMFDMDGTLVDSTASVARSWRRFATQFGVSTAALHENHGQPARVLISRVLPPERFDEAFARVTEIEVGDAVGLVPVLGARALVESVPDARRAIVTSGSVAIATARLTAAGIPHTQTWVTVEDVTHGKPHPEPFLLAASRLGVDAARCLVVEDAAAGIAAAKAAGCTVMAVTGTSPTDELGEADLIVDGLDRVRVEVRDDGLALVPADLP